MRCCVDLSIISSKRFNLAPTGVGELEDDRQRSNLTLNTMHTHHTAPYHTRDLPHAAEMPRVRIKVLQVANFCAIVSVRVITLVQVGIATL